MIVVTISRHYGAGGHKLAETLRDRFGFRLVDADSVEQMARKEKITPNWLAAMEREAASTPLHLLSKILSKGIFFRRPGLPEEYEERRRYLDFLRQTFTSMADEGGYVIVGRGAQFVLQGHPKAVHILLVADYESRVAFLIEHLGISRAEAESRIRAREKERAAIASRLFGANIDDVSLYHLVLNTSRIPYPWAQETACDLVARFMNRGP